MGQKARAAALTPVPGASVRDWAGYCRPSQTQSTELSAQAGHGQPPLSVNAMPQRTRPWLDGVHG
jgi:hypothetical protein